MKFISLLLVIASHPVGAKRRRMTGSRSNLFFLRGAMDCFALLAMTLVVKTQIAVAQPSA
jgi:hypothetical protein